MAEKEQKKRESRFFTGQGQPRLREIGGAAESSRIIEGYAIVFGVQSRLLADWGDVYREIIEPGAVTQEDLDRFDIKMTIWHNRERLLARSRSRLCQIVILISNLSKSSCVTAPGSIISR